MYMYVEKLIIKNLNDINFKPIFCKKKYHRKINFKNLCKYAEPNLINNVYFSIYFFQKEINTYSKLEIRVACRP